MKYYPIRCVFNGSIAPPALASFELFAHSCINAITIRVAVCVLTLLNCLHALTLLGRLGIVRALTFLCRL